LSASFKLFFISLRSCVLKRKTKQTN